MPAAIIGFHLGQRRIPAFRSAKRWLLTLAATAVSTYALDAVATAAGLALAVSDLLDGLGRTGALLFLAATYVAWGAGMWANLGANWELLERTGASTNVLSKAAYDLFARGPVGGRWRRIATDIGYAGTELAKETPYYAGALGATLFSDAISAVDAIIFLGGANLGAALYEVALAHGVRLFLRVRPAAYARFEEEWQPRAYLREYYSRIEPDERRTIAFFVAAIAAMPAGQRVLVYGVGPTLHHVFLAAAKASEIHLAEYLPANLAEIRRWLSRDPGAHDWRPFVAYTLQCEGIAAPSAAQIAAREALARRKITRLLAADLRRFPILDPVDSGPYDVVLSAYCADSATGDRAEWRRFMRQIGALARPGGWLLTAALRRTRGYLVGGKRFPSADLDEDDLGAALSAQADGGDVTVEAVDLGEIQAKGYSGILLGSCRRQAPAQHSCPASAAA